MMIDPLYSDTAEQPLIRQLQMPNCPVTPPPELVKQWQYEANHNEAIFPQVATQAAQWGADMELEACAEWVNTWCTSRYLGDAISADVLRAARRPKPPSLKEQALAVLDDCTNCLDGAHENTIRRALEALDD